MRNTVLAGLLATLVVASLVGAQATSQSADTKASASVSTTLPNVDVRYAKLDTGVGKPRWLIIQGTRVLFDKNGNGNLTEPGEIFQAEVTDHKTPLFAHRPMSARASLGNLLEPLTGLTVEWDPDGAVAGVCLTTGEGKKLSFSPLASEREQAATFRWGDGDLQFQIYKFAEKNFAYPKIDNAITVRIGRFGDAGAVAEGSLDRCIVASRTEGLSEDLNPVADVIFYGADGKAKPPQRVVLSNRCCGVQFTGAVDVPDWTEAKVTLSFTDAPSNWKVPELTTTIKNSKGH